MTADEDVVSRLISLIFSDFFLGKDFFIPNGTSAAGSFLRYSPYCSPIIMTDKSYENSVCTLETISKYKYINKIIIPKIVLEPKNQQHLSFWELIDLAFASQTE